MSKYFHQVPERGCRPDSHLSSCTKMGWHHNRDQKEAQVMHHIKFMCELQFSITTFVWSCFPERIIAPFINQCSATSCMTQYISPILTKNLNLTWQFVYYQYIILYRIIWWPHWEMLWGQNTIKLLNKTLMWLFLRHGCSMFGVLLDVVFHENEICKSSFCRKSKPESCCAHQSLSQPWLSGETQSPSFVLLILSLHHHFVILLCHAQNCLFSVTVAIKVTFISRYFKTLSTCKYEFLA